MKYLKKPTYSLNLPEEKKKIGIFPFFIKVLKTALKSYAY